MKKRTRLPIVGVLFLLAGCCAPPCEPDRGGVGSGHAAWGWSEPPIAFAWAILPAEAGADLFGDTEGGWRPDEADVRRVLRRVPAYLRAQLERSWPEDVLDTAGWHETIRGLLGKLDVYRCQVIGYVEEGRRLVFLNFVHRESFEPHPDDDPADLEDWTVDPHLVDDGGDWYWQLRFDPAANQFLFLTVNGEA